MTIKKETVSLPDVLRASSLESKVIENIKNVMKAKNVKQDALAEKIGLSRTAVTHILTGRVRIDLMRLFAIANVLQVDPTCLTEGALETTYESVNLSNVNIKYLPFIELGETHKWRRTLEDLITGKTFQIEERLAVQKSDHSEQSFYITVKSDMWKPVFNKGDKLSVDPLRKPANGNYAIFYFAEDSSESICQYFKEGSNVYFRRGEGMSLERADEGMYKITSTVISRNVSMI